MITAPPGTTFTCRASHITTWYPAPTSASVDNNKRDLPARTVVSDDSSQGAKITRAPQPSRPYSSALPSYNAQMVAEFQETFDHMRNGRTSNGVGVVNLDDYYTFFNVTADRRDTIFAKSVEAKFHVHDINGDGLMTMDEGMLRCDASGCV